MTESKLRINLDGDKYRGVSPERKQIFRFMLTGTILTVLVAQVLNILTDKSVPVLNVTGWLVLPIVLISVLLISVNQNISNQAFYIVANDTHVRVVYPPSDCTIQYMDMYFTRIGPSVVTLHYKAGADVGAPVSDVNLYFHSETDCLTLTRHLENNGIRSM